MSVSLTDRVVLGDLTGVFPPDLVDAVIAKAGAREVRVRRLPARLMTYFLLGRALFSTDPYREVLRKLTEAARHDGRDWEPWPIPDKAAIFRARQRLGVEPMRELLAQVGPVATAATPGAWWRGWQLMAIDGTTLEVADTAANDKEWGRPSQKKGYRLAGYPQARVMALIETGSHVVTDAEVGGFGTEERKLTWPLVRALRPGMLVLGDRGLPGVRLWQHLAATGADLLWRVNTLWKLPVEEPLPDGSWLSGAATGRRGRRADRATIRLRVIEYTLDDPGRDRGRHYRLVTTIWDPRAAPAAELAALYAERWEAETTLAEWKTGQIGPGHVLSSKSPDLVRQEIYAHLAVHAAIRALMHQTATRADPPLDPDRLSYSAALRAVRRSVLTLSPAFSP